MKNDFFNIEFMPENGGLKSLVLNSDPYAMNWIEGMKTWGVPAGMDFVKMFQESGKTVSCYSKKELEVRVEREIKQDALVERFFFRNTAAYDLYFQRGQLGIFATFNDNYTSADICETQRCHTHIWCGGENSFIHARKMGPFPQELALILTKGSLDTYSVRRIAQEISNDRGDFVLHPAPMHLLPGETKVMEWELTAFPEGELEKILLSRSVCIVKFEQETVFPEEHFRIFAKCGEPVSEAEVFCNGEKTDFQRNGSEITVNFLPKTLGEHHFEFRINGRTCHGYGYVSESLENVVDRRIRFIIRKQQMTDSRSPLYGAYLIYDNEEKSQYFNYEWGDHNACRERFGMGLLICRRLQEKQDEEMERSLRLFEQFLLREVFNTETGEVCNTIGKNSKFVRLYNAPWLITFWTEMYRLYKEPRYLEWAERSMRDYYSKGGAKFYPNGSLFSNTVKEIRDAGNQKTADELSLLVRRHVDTICANGIIYPPHEVRFEQTIVTPALSILAAYTLFITPDAEILMEAEKHAEILERFQGAQPDYRWNELPIRHWDDFWFGKRALYGDTLHYWSCLSAFAFLLYAKASGKENLQNRARHTLRNLLCLFFRDGSASCAYLHPFSVTMLNPDGSEIAPARRGEFFDPWANDQDFALYYMLRSRPFLKDKKL